MGVTHSSVLGFCFYQMRFIMKVHSFIRENAAKVLYPSAGIPSMQLLDGYHVCLI